MKETRNVGAVLWEVAFQICTVNKNGQIIAVTCSIFLNNLTNS